MWETVKKFSIFPCLRKGDNMFCKIYNDGSHYIALSVNKTLKLKKNNGVIVEISDLDKAFDELYFLALQEDFSLKQQKEFVLDGLAEKFHNNK